MHSVDVLEKTFCFYSINLFQENHYLGDKEIIKSLVKNLAKLLHYHWQSYSNFPQNPFWITAMTKHFWRQNPVP